MKRNMKKRSTAAMDISLYKLKVIKTVKMIDRKFVQTLMGGLMGKVRQFGRGDKV
jgi:hypothetical protein